jgi:hypothetical protein
VVALTIAISAPNAFARDHSSSSVASSNQESEELEHAIIIGFGGATEIEHVGLWLEPSYAFLFRDGV